MIPYESIYVIDKKYNYENYVAVDLSVNNTELDEIRLDDPVVFGNYISDYLIRTGGRVAYGGYNEARNLYRSSSIFKNSEAERDIHIGLDIWAPAGTAVLAAFDGVVHSFATNSGRGNYGPTIILEHELDGEKMYSLYGHLSADSLDKIEIGSRVFQGNSIAELGNESVNGGYPPHLHFQLIKDIREFSGDYPGVCNIHSLSYYLENCPDPERLLNIKK